MLHRRETETSDEKEGLQFLSTRKPQESELLQVVKNLPSFLGVLGNLYHTESLLFPEILTDHCEAPGCQMMTTEG